MVYAFTQMLKKNFLSYKLNLVNFKKKFAAEAENNIKKKLIWPKKKPEGLENGKKKKT